MWLIGPNTESDLRSYTIVNGLVLTAIAGDRIALGLRGTPGVLREMALAYGSNADSKAILPPMLAFSAAEQTQSLLLMTYSREQLSRASAVARSNKLSPYVLRSRPFTNPMAASFVTTPLRQRPRIPVVGAAGLFG